jgi:transcriptional regulator with XRE-family HTH domain
VRAKIEKIYPELGRKMKELRSWSGMSQLETAKRMHIGRPHLALMENGRQRIHLHTLMAFGKAVNMSVRYILEGIVP